MGVGCFIKGTCDLLTVSLFGNEILCFQNIYLHGCCLLYESNLWSSQKQFFLQAAYGNNVWIIWLFPGQLLAQSGGRGTMNNTLWLHFCLLGPLQFLLCWEFVWYLPVNFSQKLGLSTSCFLHHLASPGFSLLDKIKNSQFKGITGQDGVAEKQTCIREVLH
jgi:hypothetical protein